MGLKVATALARSAIAQYGVQAWYSNSFEQWEAEGSLDAAQRANKIWTRMLNEYEAPPLDPAIDEALIDFVNRRKAEFADRDY
jgi:trimethylamine--corrinoid protein Co-methyltransferase